MNIILGVTGSVAAKLTEKLFNSLLQNGHYVKIIPTESAVHFSHFLTKHINTCEFTWYKYSGKVSHIELREHADLLLIAPLSANTLAKISNGLCDNLLTNIARAWDFNKRFIVCPSMNVKMYEHPATNSQLNTLKDWGVKILHPQIKTLACGEYGIGAMCEIKTILENIHE